MPFPVASILWAYNAELNSEKKTLHLSHFFEALSELLAIISLSAFSSNKQIFEQSAAALSEDGAHKDDYQHATFGYWVTVSERLAKQIRRLLNDKETREQIIDAFGRPSDQFINMITNKALYSSLRETSFLRNEWFGHGGIDSEKTWDERLNLAIANLTQIRKMIADSFANMSLISANQVG